jgi:hypothetical protein
MPQRKIRQHYAWVRWNLFGRRESKLFDRLDQVLDEFEMIDDYEVSVNRRTVNVGANVSSEPPGVSQALRTAAGPRFRIQFIADPGFKSRFESPIGVARISPREATEEEKRMLLRHAAEESSDLPQGVRGEIASRLRAGEDPDLIIAWLTETMGWRPDQ